MQDYLGGYLIYNSLYGTYFVPKDLLKADPCVEEIFRKCKLDRAKLIENEGYNFEPIDSDAPIIEIEKIRIKNYVSCSKSG